MVSTPLSIVKGKTLEMWAIADCLLSISVSEHSLLIPDETHKSAYIPLSIQVNKSKKQKNTVSIHREFVSFMVHDWTIETDANLGGFKNEARSPLR